MSACPKDNTAVVEFNRTLRKGLHRTLESCRRRNIEEAKQIVEYIASIYISGRLHYTFDIRKALLKMQRQHHWPDDECNRRIWPKPYQRQRKGWSPRGPRADGVPTPLQKN